MRGRTSAGPSQRSTGVSLTSTGREVIMVGYIDFKGDGMDIPYITLLAAKEERAEN